MTSYIISGLTLIIAIATFIRAGHKDTKNQITEENSKFESIRENILKVNLKLDQLCTTTGETRIDVRTLSDSMKGIEVRVAVLERDLKTVFNIIDDLKKG